MNCKKAEEYIILYSELNPAEKKILENHLKSCFSCMALFEHAQKHQVVINQGRNQESEIPNNLTDQIMAALPDKKFKQDRKFNPIWSLNWSPLQTTLATCSLLLAFTFALELNISYETLQSEQPVKNGVMLSSNPEKFLQAKRSRSERFSLEKLINQNNPFAFSNQ